jgi:hypothetical protein
MFNPKESHRLLAVLCLTTIAALGLGVWFIASAPFDGQARSSLGGNLITAGGVGGALILIQQMISRREDARQQAQSEQMRRDTLSVVNRRMSRLVSSIISEQAEDLWMRLAENQNDSLQPEPAGWRGSDDILEVQRTLMWRIEVMGRDPDWWKDGNAVAATDAAYYVASDLAERLGLTPEAEDVKRAQMSISSTVRRLDRDSQRLSDAGHVMDALNLDDKVDVLSESNWQAFEPSTLSQPSIVEVEDSSDDDGVVALSQMVEPDPYNAYLRTLVGWLIQAIRGDSPPLSRFGTASANVEPPENYRWGKLVEGEEAGTSTWEGRFLENSWYRRLARTGARELPALFEDLLGSR